MAGPEIHYRKGDIVSVPKVVGNSLIKGGLAEEIKETTPKVSKAKKTAKKKTAKK